MLPEQVSHHLWKELSIGEWPICRRQPRVITGDERAGDDQKERRARDEQRKPM